MGGRHDPKGAGPYGSKLYRREMRGLPVQHGAYVNVCGSDLVRNGTGNFVVLEDNLRVPSGVSYMLANRDVVRRAFPAVFNSAYFEHAFLAARWAWSLSKGAIFRSTTMSSMRAPQAASSAST